MHATENNVSYKIRRQRGSSELFAFSFLPTSIVCMIIVMFFVNVYFID